MTDAVVVEDRRKHNKGRPKGSKSKRKLLRELRLSHPEPSRKAIDYLAEVLAYYRRRADSEPARFDYWMGMVMDCATRLARYQSPTFQAIAVTGTSQDQTRLAQMSNAELAMALKARAESLGMEVRMRPQVSAKGRPFIHDIDEKIVPIEPEDDAV
jgi:hypothetical protein